MVSKKKHPYLGKLPILTYIFQMGWHHQVGNESSSNPQCSGAKGRHLSFREGNMFHDANHQAFNEKYSVATATKQLQSNCNQSSQRVTSEDSIIDTFRWSTAGFVCCKISTGTTRPTFSVFNSYWNLLNTCHMFHMYNVDLIKLNVGKPWWNCKINQTHVKSASFKKTN